MNRVRKEMDEKVKKGKPKYGATKPMEVSEKSQRGAEGKSKKKGKMMKKKDCM